MRYPRMTDKVLCPWCGSEMVVYCAYDFVDGVRSANVICAMCGARGPKKCAVDMDEAKEAARAAALRRYEPPIRPLTKEEIDPEKYQTLFTEYITDLCSDWGKASDLRSDAFIHSDTYGKTWRCWPRKPTEEERKEAKWDDD